MFDFFKPKTCSICNKPLDKFKWVINPYNVRRKTTKESFYCREHFLQKLSEAILKFEYPMILSEPLDYKSGAINQSQWVYYPLGDLEVDNFDIEDQKSVMNLLQFTTDDKPIIWIDRSVIQEVTTSPIFKKDNQYEAISRDQAITRIKGALNSYDEMRGGEFLTNLPYDSTGIFVYTNYI